MTKMGYGAAALALLAGVAAAHAQDDAGHCRQDTSRAAGDPHGAHRPEAVASPDLMEGSGHLATQRRGPDHGEKSVPGAPTIQGDEALHSMTPASPARRVALPPITDEDRAAAFPDVTGHTVHDHTIRSFTLLERLEWQDGEEGDLAVWDATGWIGRDVNRLWLRTDGEVVDGRTESADLEAFWGHAIGRWWDVLAGLRHDFQPNPSRTWAAVGVQGLAPQWFEIQATAYVGEGGQVAAHFQGEYDLLLTNRLILQPRLDATAYSENDEARGIGAGLSTVEASLRLRYEIRREFAPYIGVLWTRSVGDTADFARAADEGVEDTRLVAGIRVWF